jgi:hypothetical protein
MATYYVSNTTSNGYTSGNDANTTAQAVSKATPWLTLNGAEAKAANGDTVIVNGGTYTETSTTNGWIITKGITWTNDGDVIVQNGGTSKLLWSINSTGTAHITGFTFDAQSTQSDNVLIGSGSTGLIFTGCSFINSVDYCIRLASSSSPVVTINTSTITVAAGVAFNFGNAGGTLNVVGSTVTHSGGWAMVQSLVSSTLNYTNNTTTMTPNYYGFDIVGGSYTLSGGTLTCHGTPYNLILAQSGVGTLNMSGLTISIDGVYQDSIINLPVKEWTVSITGNTITSTANQTASFIAIASQNAPVVSNNTIVTGTTNNIYIINIFSHTGSSSVVTVANNTITHYSIHGVFICTGADTAPATSNVYTGTVSGNKLYGVLYNNPATASVDVHGILVGYNNNVAVYNNLINGTGYGPVIKHDGSANAVYSSGGVYYNLLINCRGNSGIRIKGAKNVPIYNNVIYNDLAYTGFDGISVSINAAGELGSCIAKNNIFYGNPAYALRVDATSTLISDYNCIYGISSGSTGLVGATAYATLSNWQAVGYDVHSVNSNPLFVLNGTDFHPQSTSPVVKAGIDVGLTADYNGFLLHHPPNMGVYDDQSFVHSKLSTKIPGNGPITIN